MAQYISCVILWPIAQHRAELPRKEDRQKKARVNSPKPKEKKMADHVITIDESAVKVTPAEAGETAAGKEVGSEENVEAGGIAETQEEVTDFHDGTTSSEVEDEIDWSRISDSTSLQEIHMVVSGDVGKLLGDTELQNEVLLFGEDALRDEVMGKTDNEQLNFAKALVIRYHKQLNKAMNSTGAVFTEYAITMGKALVKTKKLVKRCGHKWEEWVVKNLNGISGRTIQKYMLMAKRSDARDYKVLGMERLYKLIVATKDDEDQDDPIGEFLERFKITYNPESGETVEEFKEKVDAGILVSKLSKAGIEVDFELMKRFVRSRLNPNGRMLEDLKLIKDDRSMVEKYMQKVIANQGKLPEPMDATKIGHFTSMVQRMTRTIGQMVGDSALAQQLELKDITALEEKLVTLKRLISAN